MNTFYIQPQLTFCKINDGSLTKNTFTNPNVTNIATLINDSQALD